jgi:DedD protein
MALPSFFKRNAAPSKPAGRGKAAAGAGAVGDEAAPALAARARARRRLIGAVVLLAVGVVVFPMLFETQPRPLPTNIPIELPVRDPASPVAATAPRHAPAVAEAPVAEPAPAITAAAEPAEAAKTAVRTVEAGAEAKPATPAPAPVVPKPDAGKPETPAKLARPDAAAVPVVPPKAAASAADTRQADTRQAEAQRAESARARAALEGRNPPAPPSTPAAADAKVGRFVVQVGAFTDANTLRDVRSKVEKLGMKTYTQSIDTDAGRRTRVRVGPFNNRAEAEAASTRLKAAGLPGNVLTL